GVREEIIFGIEGETKIRGFGRGLDGFSRTGEEMPAGIRFGAAEMSQRFLFLFGGHLRRFAAIEADENNFVVAPGVEGEHAQHADDALFDLIAKQDRKSTRLNSSHVKISYAVFCLKKKR